MNQTFSLGKLISNVLGQLMPFWAGFAEPCNSETGKSIVTKMKKSYKTTFLMTGHLSTEWAGQVENWSVKLDA